MAIELGPTCWQPATARAAAMTAAPRAFAIAPFILPPSVAPALIDIPPAPVERPSRLSSPTWDQAPSQDGRLWVDGHRLQNRKRTPARSVEGRKRPLASGRKPDIAGHGSQADHPNVSYGWKATLAPGRIADLQKTRRTA